MSLCWVHKQVLLKVHQHVLRYLVFGFRTTCVYFQMQFQFSGQWFLVSWFGFRCFVGPRPNRAGKKSYQRRQSCYCKATVSTGTRLIEHDSAFKIIQRPKLPPAGAYLTPQALNVVLASSLRCQTDTRLNTALLRV